MNKTLRGFLGCIIGLAMMVGSVYSYKVYNIDGFPAFIFACSGGFLVWHSLES